MSSTPADRPALSERIPALMRRLSGQHAQAFASLVSETDDDEAAHVVCERFEHFAAQERP
jgi:hypothetical protein